jgi:hypothetical protein
MTLTSLLASLCGCFDFDKMMIDLGVYDEKKDVNAKYNVILRENDGYVCVDESNQKYVWEGDPVIFKIQIRDGYIYMGNSAGAEYNSDTRTLKIKRVTAPDTRDVLVGNKYDLYCVDVIIPSEIKEKNSSENFPFIRGGEWSNAPGTVTVSVKDSYDKSVYKFVEWKIYEDGALIDYTGSSPDVEEFTFQTLEKGIVKIEAVFESAD